ncbi:MAG: hypothetical protein WBA97_34620 [Actinophytocola sp.]|uniref:hypothetical protein n=1 Tax=Actinophytocola sp. TaxID=1872138 RepID=UPI003C725D84
MTPWNYILLSVPWTGVGLLVGWLMGRSTVAVDALADAVQDEGDPVPEGQIARRSRFTGTHVLGAIIVILGVFTAVQSYVQSDATARLTECQTAYANGFADALDARSTATSEAQDALDQLLSSVAAVTPTEEGRRQFQDALTAYLEKRAVAKKAQQENPYPSPPRDVCKEDG